MKNIDNCKIPLVVVVFLGIIGIILTSGILLLTYFDKTIDGGLSTLAGGVVGALGALLTNTRAPTTRGSDAPQEVVGPNGGAVPVTEAHSKTEIQRETE